MINQEYIENIYNKIKNDKIEGKNADYIPELSKVDEKLYALSIYTVNGETYNYGDYNHKFSIESCSKVFTLALALEKYGIKQLKSKIGDKSSSAAGVSMIIIASVFINKSTEELSRIKISA